MSRSAGGGLSSGSPTVCWGEPEKGQTAEIEVRVSVIEAVKSKTGSPNDGSGGHKSSSAGAGGFANNQQQMQQASAAKDGDAAEQDPVSEQPEGAAAVMRAGGAELETCAGDELQAETETTGSSVCPSDDRGSFAAADEKQQTGRAAGNEAVTATSAGAGPASDSPSTRALRRSMMNLTFSGPPKHLERLPRTAARANYSHSQQRVRQILAANDALVRRLGEIACQPAEHERSQEKHDKFTANMVASSTRRRAGEARRVMQQNLRIFQRLQEVQPSRDVARAAHEKDFDRHKKMLAALAELRKKGHAGRTK